MDMVQRAQVGEDARFTEPRRLGGGPLFLTAVLAAVIVLAALACLLNVVLGAVIMVLGIAAVPVFYRLRSAEEDDESDYAADEAEEEEPAAYSAGRGNFVALGTNPAQQPKTSVLANQSMAIKTPPKRIKVETVFLLLPDPEAEASCEVFLGKDPRTAVEQRSAALDQLIQKTAANISAIEPVLTARMHKNRQTELQSFLQAKDILAALKQRQVELNQLLKLPDWSDDEARRGWELCYGIVEICRDSLTSIISDQNNQKYTLLDCEKKIEEILSLFKKRKTFYNALRLQDL